MCIVKTALSCICDLKPYAMAGTDSSLVLLRMFMSGSPLRKLGVIGVTSWIVGLELSCHVAIKHYKASLSACVSWGAKHATLTLRSYKGPSKIHTHTHTTMHTCNNWKGSVWSEPKAKPTGWIMVRKLRRTVFYLSIFSGLWDQVVDICKIPLEWIIKTFWINMVSRFIAWELVRLKFPSLSSDEMLLTPNLTKITSSSDYQVWVLKTHNLTDFLPQAGHNWSFELCLRGHCCYYL